MEDKMFTEDSTSTRRATNPLGAYLNACYRSIDAEIQHAEFFDSAEHTARLDSVKSTLRKFFGKDVDYVTARGLNRSLPFHNVKMGDVGTKLSKMSKDAKWKNLYAPLLAFGDVDVLSTNGHLLVRIYPVGRMPKPSKNSITRWYSEQITAA
jgi:hypothetical protein